MARILAIDVGNSNAVFAFMENGKARYIERLPTRLVQSEGEAAELCHALLLQQGADISGAIISSVVPAWIPLLRRLLIDFTGRPPLLVSPSLESPIGLQGYDPHSLGMDRLTDAAMAREKYGSPVAVFDLGTCTTLSIVGREGSFLGGSISPGIQLSLDAEAEHTASLPPLKARQAAELIGRDTASCMLSGAIIGTAAMIDGMAAKLSARFREEENLAGSAGKAEGAFAQNPSLPVVLTGGLAPLVLPWLSYPVHHEPDLLLEGLALLYAYNA